jgi:hypothetical protein
MGNTPSNARAPHSNTASPSGSLSPSSHESSRAPSSRRVIQPQRSAAAPEPSLTQARGTTVTTTHRSSRQAQAIPSAALNLAQSSHSNQSNQSNPSPSSPSPARQQNSDSQMGAQPSRPDPKIDTRDQPSKPVDVPVPAPNLDSSSLRSYSQSIEPSGPVAQDMSYHLTRPPRLPLPIEEEVHTPGSPIIAPQDTDISPLDSDSLDQDTLPRRASALSNTTIDEEDAEELRVDKTKATVPTTLEWLEGKGGEKVYVTGTIFQWNKKHRLHPV